MSIGGELGLCILKIHNSEKNFEDSMGGLNPLTPSPLGTPVSQLLTASGGLALQTGRGSV